MTTRSWIGPQDGLWSVSGNWSNGVPVNGDSVEFYVYDSNHTRSNNNLTNLELSGITFVSDAFGHTISGNLIKLNGGISSGCNQFATDTVATPLEISGSPSFSNYNGGRLNISGALSGSSSLYISDRVTLSHASGNTLGSGGIYTNNNDCRIYGIYPSSITFGSGSGLEFIANGNHDYDLNTSSDITLGGGLTIRGNTSIYGNVTVSGVLKAVNYNSYTAFNCSGYIYCTEGTLISNRTFSANTLDFSYGGTVEPGDGVVGGTLDASYSQIGLAYSGSKVRLRLHGNGSTANSKLIGSSIYLGSTQLEIVEYLEPTAGSVFTICQAGYVSGEFSVGPDGSTFVQQGRTFRINYTGSAVTLTDITSVTREWTGQGTTDNWSDAGNWSNGVPQAGDSLRFTGSSRTSTNNNLGNGFQVKNVTFDYSNFMIWGDSLVVTGDVTVTGPSGQFFVGVSRAADQMNIYMNSGSVSFHGGLSAPDCPISINGSGSVATIGGTSSASSVSVLSGGINITGELTTYSVDVYSGAYLHGSGTIVGNAYLYGGATFDASQGSGWGTLTATGTVTFEYGSSFQCEMSGPNSCDSITANTVQNNGANLNTYGSGTTSVNGNTFRVIYASSSYGYFENLGQGNTVTVWDRSLQASYDSGGLVLTDISSPPPTGNTTGVMMGM